MKAEIKSTDIRIGNYIYGVNNRIEKVISLGVNFVRSTHYKIDIINEYSDISGISLSPEILEKAAILNQVQFQHWGNGMTEICTEYGDFSVLTRQLQYLHQLQNIYHALTGEELNIEL